MKKTWGKIKDFFNNLVSGNPFFIFLMGVALVAGFGFIDDASTA